MSDFREVWAPYEPGFEYPVSVLDAKERMNAEGFEGVMGSMPLLEDRRENGIAFTVHGDEGSSTDEAALLYLAFANRTSPHNRIKAEFIRRVLGSAGITDSEGKPLPVVTMSSPARGSTLHLDAQATCDVERGRFYQAVKPSLEIVKNLGFGKTAIAGHSQGGTFAVFAAGQAHYSGLDVRATAASDMPGTREFTRGDLFKVFGADADYLSEEVINAGLEPYTEALGYSQDRSWLRKRLQDLQYVFDVAAHPRVNNALFTGLTRDTFSDALKQAVWATTTTHLIGFGSKDKIVTDRLELERTVQAASDYVIPTPDVKLVEIADGRHTWSDNVPLYGTFVLRSLQAAKAA